MMAMGRYIGVRLLHALVILVLVTMLVFIIAQLIPGDAVMAAMASSVDMSDSEVVARVRLCDDVLVSEAAHRPEFGERRGSVFLQPFARAADDALGGGHCL